MGLQIKKNTGEKQDFDIEKLQRSLTRPGANEALVEEIVQEAQTRKEQFDTTEDIFRFALERLKAEEPHIAARYNVKRALLDFGPTGYPFEKYIAALLQEQGYKVKTNAIVSGWCVDHEIDIIAKKDNETFMVECKFHNKLGYRTNVKVALYTKARFDDIERTWQPDSPEHKLTRAWIFTNTEFTYEALKYSNCVDIALISWDYPKKGNLAELITRRNMYPITAITWLSDKQKELLVKHDLVLAKNIANRQDILQQVGIDKSDINRLVRECGLLCE